VKLRQRRPQFNAIFFCSLFRGARIRNWPDSSSGNLIITVSIFVSFVSQTLVMSHYFRNLEAVMDEKVVKIDFK
jgi:hypothetical protein